MDQREGFARRGFAPASGGAWQPRRKMLSENLPRQIRLGKATVLSPEGEEGKVPQNKAVKL